jgi:hypothetical protein
MTVQFYDELPPTHNAGYDWSAIARRLMHSPGRWGLVFENDKVSIVTAIKAGHIAALKPWLGFECSTRNNYKDGSIRYCDLFMRYRPELVTEEPPPKAQPKRKRKKKESS